MSNPTSSIQLLGGLLSMSPSSGANNLLSMDNQAVSSSSDAFYTLWVGLTQTNLADTTLNDLQRQTQDLGKSVDGRILPLELPKDVIKQIDNLLQQAKSGDEETLEQLVSLLKDSLKEALERSDVSISGQSANASVTMSRDLDEDSNSLDDQQLLAYLKGLQKLNKEKTDDSEVSLNHSKDNLLNLLVAYLDQKATHTAAVTAEESLNTTPPKESVQALSDARLRQLWAELEAAKQQKQALLAEDKSQNGVLEKDQPLAGDAKTLGAEAVINSADQAQTSDARSGQSLENAIVSSLAQQTLLAGQEATLSNEELRLSEREQLVQAVRDQLISQSNLAADDTKKMESPTVVPMTADKSVEKNVEQRILQSSTPTIFSNTNPSTSNAGPLSPELTPAERIALSDSALSDNNKRVLADAITQANADKKSMEEKVSDTNRRQESMTTATSVVDSSRWVQSPASPAQSPVSQAHNAQDALMQKMLNPAWSRALGERAVMMAQQGPRLAEVRLDPPELGALRIKVQVHGNDQVSLTFNAPNASVREVLEQSLPRLREMFAEQGMNLADASVSDQSSQQQSEQAQAREGNRVDSTIREEFGELPASRTELRKVGIIDYYA